MAIYARLENGTYAEVTGVYKTDGTEVTEIFQGDRLVYSASNEIYGSLPLYYNGKGYDLTDYRISGNAVQDGTPTPESPVPVVGCGTDTADGFKLPLTVNGTEYPIYLGTVPTTRRIKKLVLTGEETVRKDTNSGRSARYFIAISGIERDTTNLLSSHFTYSPWYEPGTMKGYVNTVYFSMESSQYPEIADFKSYLAAQYAAGTPVTVWYVLAEPETAVVNEPLMKIGDYADTVSFAQAGVTIPTVSGANVLDMASTVKPSEVYVKGKGIKPTGYGQLADVNGVSILDKDSRPIYVHGQ